MRRTAAQLSLTPRRPHPEHPGWGGARKGAGRPRSKDGGVPHRARPVHKASHPVHATLRLTRELSPLRTKRKLKAVKSSLRDTYASRNDFRVVHFSLQNTHLHLIVEAQDKGALARGLRALQIRIARRLNHLAQRKGRVFTDRYHARALATPRETRAALCYVLLNGRHHAGRSRSGAWLDPCSSASSFEGWSRPCALPPGYAELEPVVATASPRTWLLRVGWSKHGPISPDEVPGQQ
jgi:REP element-mobilizing transposase RayT